MLYTSRVFGTVFLTFFFFFPLWAENSGDIDIHIHEHAERGEKKIAPFFFTKLAKERFPHLDIWKDESVERFVSREIPLEDRSYRPKNLLAISGAYISEAGRVGYLRSDALQYLRIFAKDFYKEFGSPLIIISGYRSADYQKRLWDLGRCTPELCAPPGYSEHQLGLAIDMFDASTAESYMANARLKRYITWVQANAHRYGYTQSYQKGSNIDGYGIEPWHWRYVGVDLATKLYKLQMTYSEYIEWESMWRVLSI